MIDRIKENEERLDKLLISTKNLENALNDFSMNINDLALLNEYYGSKEWFKDKEKYEKNKISKVKAGVLSEDAVWNLNEDISDLLNVMQELAVDLFIINKGGESMEKKCNCSKDCKCGCQQGKPCTCKDKKCKCGCHEGKKCTCNK